MKNVYVVNYLANGELTKKRGKMWICFLDIIHSMP